jgi:hypothetical protein
VGRVGRGMSGDMDMGRGRACVCGDVKVGRFCHVHYIVADEGNLACSKAC